jgi:DNA polymerase III epsilon subunit-like protein
VGELYEFPIKVISETSLASGLATIENRFVIEGHYKYTFNNGHLAMADPKAAATNFLNALEKIPGIIAQRKEKNEALAKDIPQLQDMAGKVWKKEDELKQLKTELSALDRKIQLELAKNNPAPENVKEEQIDNGISNKEDLKPMQEKNSPVLPSSDELKVNSYKGFRL